MIFIIVSIIKMKVIVNRNQYDKVIKESRGYSKSVEKWADYTTDELLPLILKQDVEEDVYVLKKLSIILKGKDFYLFEANEKNEKYEKNGKMENMKIMCFQKKRKHVF